MSGARAHGAHATFAVVLGLAGMLSTLLSGCGIASGSDDARTDPPSAAATKCRAEWSTLGDQLAKRAAATTPSTLPSRQNTLVATVDYYAKTGTAKDCGAALDKVRRSLTAETALSRKVAAYDLELALAQVRSRATAYASQKAAAGKAAGEAVGKAARKPEPAQVAVALRTLTTQAPLASAQQESAWQQVEVLSLDDPRALAKSMKDLAFLSSQSPAYRSGRQALATIRAAIS
jgi:hypothetical protein